MTSFLSRARNGWIVAAVFLLLALGLGNIPLLSGNAAPQYDAADFFGPEFILVGDQIKSGHLLKWNPWAGAGGPDLAEPELGTTSPILLAASFLSINPQEGYIAYWMAVWAFGGIGMLMLTRHLRCPACGGAIAALGFVASGFYTGHAEHLSSLYSISFLPWILWRLDESLEDRNWWFGTQAGVLYGLSGMGGYPAFTIMTPGFLLLWVLGKVVCGDVGGQSESRRPMLAWAATSLLLTTAIGFAIFSQPYAGIIAGTRGYSDHIGPRPREVSISSNLLSAGAISTFASPYLALLNFQPEALWPRTDVSMTSIYTGGVTMVLAIFGWRRRSAWRWWLVLMIAFFGACSLGSQLPLRGWLYDLVPPTRYFRNPALFRAYVIFLMSILAALATRDLVAASVSTANRVRLWLISAFIACASVICFGVVIRMASKSMPEFRVGTFHVVLIWFGLAGLTFVLKERFLSVQNFLRLAAVLALIDAAGSLYISRPTICTAATVPWWHEMNMHHAVGPVSVGWKRVLHPPEALGTYANNRNIPLNVAVFDSYIVLWNRFQQQMVADPALSRMAIGADRLCFSPDVAWRAPDDESFKQFRERVHNLAGQTVLVLHSPEQMLALTPADAGAPSSQQSTEALAIPACVPASVSDLHYKPDSLSFRYLAPTAGYLLVTDRWASGWDTKVNGRRSPTLGGNFIFRAVQVESGANLIEFQYSPKLFWPFVVLSWGTLVLFVFGQALRLWIMKRRPESVRPWLPPGLTR
jgi:hypothetical protein